MKPLIVGQASSQSTVGKPALAGQGGFRLARLADIPHKDFLARCDAVNLIDGWTGKAKSGKGDAVDIKALRAGSAKVPIAGRRVLCLGRAVARAFGAPARLPYFQRFSAKAGDADADAWLFPHPSGVSRFWNDAANQARAREFLRAFIAGTL